MTVCSYVTLSRGVERNTLPNRTDFDHLECTDKNDAANDTWTTSEMTMATFLNHTTFVKDLDMLGCLQPVNYSVHHLLIATLRRYT